MVVAQNSSVCCSTRQPELALLLLSLPEMTTGLPDTAVVLPELEMTIGLPELIAGLSWMTVVLPDTAVSLPELEMTTGLPEMLAGLSWRTMGLA